jgi:type I restriction enzyme R subunit
VVELAEAILHPESSSDYPLEVKDSSARRALFDFFDKNAELAVAIDKAVCTSLRPDWKKNFQKQQIIRGAIYQKLMDKGYSEEDAVNTSGDIYDLVQRQDEYDE